MPSRHCTDSCWLICGGRSMSDHKTNGLESASTDQALTPQTERSIKEAETIMPSILTPEREREADSLSNAKFLQTIFGSLEPSEYCWTTAFVCSPSAAGNIEWGGKRAYPDTVEDTPHGNSYFSVAAFKSPPNNPSKRNQHCFNRLVCVVLDDIQSIDLSPTWRIETSAGNYQIGFKLNQPIRDYAEAAALHRRFKDAGAISGNDPNGNNAVRYVRLPVGTNTKHEMPFRTRLDLWNPSVTASVEDLLAALGVEPEAALGGPLKAAGERESDADLIRHIVSGDNYHDPIRTLTARYVKRGMDRHSVVQTVEGFMAQSNDGSERWRNRRDNILRATEGAVEKYAPKENLLSEYLYSISTPKPVEYVLDGFIANKLTLIAGAPGVGKSTAIVSLAAIAAGIMRAEGITAELPRQVFYVTEDAEQIERILYGLRAQRIVTESEAEVSRRLKLIHAKRRPAVEVARMIQAARSIGVTTHHSGYEVEPLIVLDTANATLDLDNENDNSEAGKAISAIKEAMGNAAIWIVGHTAKAIKRADLSNLSFRGAGAFEGDTNATSYLFADEAAGTDRTFLALGKHRYVSTYQEIQFDSFAGKVSVATAWGTTQECWYRVGVPSQSSAEQREKMKQAQREVATQKDSEQAKRRIVFTVLNQTKDGESINRTRVKQLIGGKSETVTALINDLIDEGYLKESKSEGKRGYDLQALKPPEQLGTIGNNSHRENLKNVFGESFPRIVPL